MSHWIFVLDKKTVMPKKKYIVPRYLKDCLPKFTTQKRKSKKKMPVFLQRVSENVSPPGVTRSETPLYRDNFVLP